jgi:hypothetical protein
MGPVPAAGAEIDQFGPTDTFNPFKLTEEELEKLEELERHAKNRKKDAKVFQKLLDTFQGNPFTSDLMGHANTRAADKFNPFGKTLEPGEFYTPLTTTREERHLEDIAFRERVDDLRELLKHEYTETYPIAKERLMKFMECRANESTDMASAEMGMYGHPKVSAIMDMVTPHLVFEDPLDIRAAIIEALKQSNMLGPEDVDAIRAWEYRQLIPAVQ